MFYEVCTILLISSSFATAGASVVTSVPCAAAWCCASCWQTAASSNAETSGVCNFKTFRYKTYHIMQISFKFHNLLWYGFTSINSTCICWTASGVFGSSDLIIVVFEVDGAVWTCCWTNCCCCWTRGSGCWGKEMPLIICWFGLKKIFKLFSLCFLSYYFLPRLEIIWTMFLNIIPWSYDIN